MDHFKDEPKSKESNDSINLLHMLESRITEIVQIEKEVKKKFPKLFHQRLPRFMRRRAASHNIKRIPKLRRPKKLDSKDRSKLLSYRRKIRYLKHKRVLKSNQRHVYKDKSKSVLHKWFAKRFKIERTPGSALEQVPLYNNTKNQRNLYRQTRYGCAYFSLAHLIALRVENTKGASIIDKLNILSESISGFTFSARALETGRYELVIHLYAPANPNESEENPSKKLKLNYKREYICPIYVTDMDTYMILWVPRTHVDRVLELYRTSFHDLNISKIQPCDWTRVRLVGPNAREESMKIAEDLKLHQQAILDVDRRLAPCEKSGFSIGRYLEEKDASFTYYPTDLPSVDIVLRRKAGRMLWHKLIKNKAHLVGGKRDVDILLASGDFKLEPDHLREEMPKTLKTKRTVISRSKKAVRALKMSKKLGEKMVA